jgi:hypothetical protein
MDKLYDLLLKINKRPKMYLKRTSLKYLRVFLNGYVACINHIDSESHFEFYPGFQEFIQEKYNVSIPKHWTSIIEFYCFAEGEAFNRFFELLEEFLENQHK